MFGHKAFRGQSAKWMVGLALSGVMLTGMATPTKAATLNDELSVLLTAHPRVKAAQNEVRSADEGIRGAFSGYLPSVNLESSYGWERISSPTIRDRGKDRTSLGTDSTSLTITQMLWDGFRREAGYDGAKLTKTISEIGLDATRQSLAFDGARAYIDVLRSVRLVELARNNELTVQRQLNLEDERVQRGAGVAIDVLFAKSRLQIAKERRVAFEGQLQEAVARYEQLFGRTPPMNAMSEPVVAQALLPASREDALKVALQDNPNLTSASRQIDLAATRQTAAESDYYPRIDLVGRGTLDHNSEGNRGERTEVTALIRARWQIFNGFATQAAVAQASYQIAARRDQFDASRRQVTEQVDTAWSELETANRRVALLENAVSIASEVFDARRRLRDAGRETAINVLDAENEVYNARINLVSAAFDARRAAYRVLLATGRLTPANLGIVMPGEKP